MANEISTSSTISALLAAFPTQKSVPVRWGDMDAMGHVNNTVYFQYFEEIRVPMINALSLSPDALEENNGLGPILAAIDCRFKLPVTYPDTLHLGGTIERMTDDRLFFLFHAVSEQHKRVAAVGHCEIVSYDYHEGRKVKMPESTKARVRQHYPQVREDD